MDIPQYSVTLCVSTSRAQAKIFERGSVCLNLLGFVFVVVNRLVKNVKYARNLVPSLDQRDVNMIVHYLAIRVR